MDIARADLEQSMSMTGKPYLSRRYLIVVSRYAGPSGSGGTHYAEATKLAPQSVEVRLEHMTDLEPRWGGSYAAMEALVSASRAEIKDPAMVARVAARVPDYRAFESQRKRQYAEALRFYDEALRLEESAYTLCARSYVLAEMQRYEEALEDVKRGLSKRRDEDYCVERGVWAALRSQDWPEVVAVTTLVLEVDPAAVLALTHRGWALRELGKHELAFQDYLKAANLGDAYAQLNVGRFYLNGIGTKQDREQTTVWFRRAAVQGEPDAYRLLDGLLQERAAQN
jgi:tetratricopeptide (TPR) repeat protein